MKHLARAEAELPAEGVNKWEVLRDLATARTEYGLSDRDLSVLQALVSFHRPTVLEGADLVVHPSNRAICERLNGMPCSTMRRHLSRLVQAGVVLRRDSPNGKRYARRFGDEKIAYGFDLAPLVARAAEFQAAAERHRQAALDLARHREAASLMRRDLAALVEYGRSLEPDRGLWDRLSDAAVLAARELRRKLSVEELTELAADLRACVEEARSALGTVDTGDMSTNGVESGQHYQSSKEDSYEPEPRLEKARGGGRHAPDPDVVEEGREGRTDPPPLPLGLVLSVCGEIQGYAPDPIENWHRLVVAAETVRPMMGVSASAWEEAKREMGPEVAAATLAAMLERFDAIRSPGGYLRSLTAKAAAEGFSCAPMIMALTRRAA